MTSKEQTSLALAVPAHGEGNESRPAAVSIASLGPSLWYGAGAADAEDSAVGFYARHGRVRSPDSAAPARPGPEGPGADATLLEHIRLMRENGFLAPMRAGRAY